MEASLDCSSVPYARRALWDLEFGNTALLGTVEETLQGDWGFPPGYIARKYFKITGTEGQKHFWVKDYIKDWWTPTKGVGVGRNVKELAGRWSMDTLAMTAVALQDHISRSVQLSFTDPSKRNLRNTRDKKNFRDCQVKPRVDSGLKIKTVTKNRDDTQEEEYVLDPNPPRLTLAQRMGLVEAPAMPLTADEWYKVKERSIREGDLSQPCAICKEDLGLQQQVPGLHFTALNV
ncbi:RNF32 protein, partial [Polypterus senegalus]